jgi:hypothetical protein
MFDSLTVRTIDDCGSLKLRSDVNAHVLKIIPVEGEAKDGDGVAIHLLLHVVNGRPVELEIYLEIYKDDGSSVKEMPPASAFALEVLPAAPERPTG